MIEISGEAYPIIIDGDQVTAGCQTRSVEEWRTTSKRRVITMDRRDSVRFAKRFYDILDEHFGKGERPSWVNELEG